MIQLTVCPSTLEKGFDTYSPAARRTLFDGRTVSHYLKVPSPSTGSPEAQGAVQNARRISLSGVQAKYSVIIDEATSSLRYTKEHEQGTYILKPCPSGYHILNRAYCAANEHLTMQIAAQVYGIETAANGLCFYSNDEAAYLTRRFDVHASGKYQQEDFASLMGYTKADGGSEYKYCNGSYEDCSKIIQLYVKAARIDLLRFFRLVVFNFISLNDDAHLKNFSLLNQGNEYRLSPAYDLINTSLHLPAPGIFALDRGLFKEGMNLSDTHLVGRKDFEEFGKRIGLPQRLIQRELDNFAEEKPLAQALIERSFLSEALKRQYKASTAYRRQMLSF